MPPKVRYFYWLVLHDRCWTAERRKRRGLQDSDDCALCSQASETINHLLVTCVFTKEVWFLVLHAFGLQQLASNPNIISDFYEWWLR